MSRTILIDANVVDQINRGNAQAAQTLLGMIRNGDRVYISQQAYNELVVNALPRMSTANRLALERLNISIAPAGPMATRVDVYAQNQTRAGTVVSEPDSLVAAQARAVGAELWSFDRAFRTNGAAVSSRLGVQVAPETQSIPLVGGAGGAPAAQADYRVGHQLLGLPPVQINFSGQIIRTGPPGAPPGAGGTPPANLPGGGGPIGGGGGSSAAGRGGTTASVGVADNRLPSVGGPSPRGTAIGGGIVLGLQGLNFILNTINDEVQARAVQAALARIEPQINKERAANPSLGVLLIFFYRQNQGHPDSPIRPGPVFTHIETATGLSRDEAREKWAHTDAIRPGAGWNEEIFSQEVWIPPIRPAGVAALRTPFPPAGLGSFATAKLQDVEWGGVTGFDDEGETTLQLGGASAQFVILRPPAEIQWWNGRYVMKTDIPLVTRTTADGSPLSVVDLDPWNVGKVAAAMVFPADDSTDALFAQGPPTRDNLNLLRGYTNMKKLRWVRPDNIRVSRLLA